MAAVAVKLCLARTSENRFVERDFIVLYSHLFGLVSLLLHELVFSLLQLLHLVLVASRLVLETVSLYGGGGEEGGGNEEEGDEEGKGERRRGREREREMNKQWSR